MNLKPLIPSEVSQKEKYHILRHIYRIYKNGTKEFIYRAKWRNRHREQPYEYGERGGEGEMYGESNMETYVIICKIDNQQEYVSGNSNRGSVST